MAARPVEPDDVEPEAPLKAAAAVATELRRRIAAGALRPGDRLPPEDGLMAEFGLARTTLREALRILEHEGLITVVRGRNGGPRVTHPEVDRLARGLALHLQLASTTFGDLDAARQLIEPALVANLAKDRTDDDLAALDEAIDQAAAAAKADDRHRFGLAAAGVHETLCELGGNQTLATIARMLQEVVDEYYRFAARKSRQEDMDRAVRSYRRLRRFIADQDADGAADHWRKQMRYTIAGLDRDEPLDLFRPA